MQDRLIDTFQGFHRLADQVFPGLGQYGNLHIFRNQIFFHQFAGECKIVLRCRREGNFDFLEADFRQHLEILQFAGRIHGDRQCLIAVTQVHTGPNRRLGQNFIRPLPVGRNDPVQHLVFRNIRHFLLSLSYL